MLPFPSSVKHRVPQQVHPFILMCVNGLQGFWVEPGARPSPAFRLCWKKPPFLNPVCYITTIFNESYHVEEFEKPHYTVYMVASDVGSNVGSSPNHNDKYIKWAQNPCKEEKQRLFLTCQFLKWFVFDAKIFESSQGNVNSKGNY